MLKSKIENNIGTFILETGNHCFNRLCRIYKINVILLTNHIKHGDNLKIYTQIVQLKFKYHKNLNKCT